MPGIAAFKYIYIRGRKFDVITINHDTLTIKNPYVANNND